MIATFSSNESRFQFVPKLLISSLAYWKGKSLFYLLQLSSKFGFPPTTIKPGISPPSTFQTVHFTSLERFWRLFATVTIVLSFSFLKKFQLNLWKIIVNHKKNHKIENPILLDSTWVDIRSEYIIWYTLVQFFYCNFIYIFFYN